MDQSKKSTEAKVIKLYPSQPKTSNEGSFNCPAVNLIYSLREEIRLLREQLTKENAVATTKLDNSDLLRIYKICRATASNWRNAGLSHTKVGSKIYYEQKDVEEFLKKHHVKAF